MKHARKFIILLFLISFSVFTQNSSFGVIQNDKNFPITTEDGEKELKQSVRVTAEPDSVTPDPNLKPPPNAIITPNGGYYTVPHLFDSHGNRLKIIQGKLEPLLMYYPMIKAKIPAIPCPHLGNGLWQEGGNWLPNHPGNDLQAVGFEEKWTSPSGNLDSNLRTGNGIFFNPVNFYYPTNPPQLDFFQIDYGMGNWELNGWWFTPSNIDSTGVRNYHLYKLNPQPPIPGSYTVTIVLERTPLANPSQTVVQITPTGSATSLTYPFIMGYKPDNSRVFGFSSYQDEFLQDDTSMFSFIAPKNSEPKIIGNFSGVFVSQDVITGFSKFDNLNTNVVGLPISHSYDILTPYQTSQKEWRDKLDCNAIHQISEPPRNLQGSSGSKEADLKWDPPFDNGGSSVTYRIERDDGSGFHAIANTPTTSYEDTGLTYGQSYPYRVFAINSAGTSLSSNEAVVKPGCLIATAAFGNELAPQVQFLRDFRDNHLQTTSVGSEFMKVFNQWYYSFSPNVADYEIQNPLFREVIKDSIYPLLGILFVSEKAFFLIGGNYGTITAGLITVSMMGAVYISPLTLSIKRVRKGRFNLKLAALIVVGILVSAVGSVLSGNQTAIMIGSLLFLLSIIAFTALTTATMFVKIAKKLGRKNYRNL